MSRYIVRILPLHDDTYCARVWETHDTEGRCIYQTPTYPYRASAYRDAQVWVLLRQHSERPGTPRASTLAAV